MMMMKMMMNCFCGMVDQRKVFRLISSWDHCQRFLPLRIIDIPQAGHEPAQNLSPDLLEWSCEVVITTTPWRHKWNDHIRICPKITVGEAAIGRYSSWKRFIFSRKADFLTLQINWRTVPVVGFSATWRTSAFFQLWILYFLSRRNMYFSREIFLIALALIGIFKYEFQDG